EPRLRGLLQSRLEVVEVLELDARDLLSEDTIDHVPRRRVPAVQVHRADQRLEHVGEDLWLITAAALLFTFTEQDPAADVELTRDLAQRRFADDLLASDAEIAFVRLREPRHHAVAGDEIEHRVAQKP